MRHTASVSTVLYFYKAHGHIQLAHIHTGKPPEIASAKRSESFPRESFFVPFLVGGVQR
ncbi:hypothetical protein CGRA01v4_10181 [Colletotrichum graminicola]|nr:hypothetical protein CGRA01v4_10181 [Colletotrichum graminicola]